MLVGLVCTRHVPLWYRNFRFTGQPSCCARVNVILMIVAAGAGPDGSGHPGQVHHGRKRGPDPVRVPRRGQRCLS